MHCIVGKNPLISLNLNIEGTLSFNDGINPVCFCVHVLLVKGDSKPSSSKYVLWTVCKNHFFYHCAQFIEFWADLYFSISTNSKSWAHCCKTQSFVSQRSRLQKPSNMTAYFWFLMCKTCLQRHQKYLGTLIVITGCTNKVPIHLGT